MKTIKIGTVAMLLAILASVSYGQSYPPNNGYNQPYPNQVPAPYLNQEYNNTQPYPNQGYVPTYPNQGYNYGQPYPYPSYPNQGYGYGPPPPPVIIVGPPVIVRRPPVYIAPVPLIIHRPRVYGGYGPTWGRRGGYGRRW